MRFQPFVASVLLTGLVGTYVPAEECGPPGPNYRVFSEGPGTGGAAWQFAGNWIPAGIPTSQDVVCIPCDQTANLTVGTICTTGPNAGRYCNGLGCLDCNASSVNGAADAAAILLLGSGAEPHVDYGIEASNGAVLTLHGHPIVDSRITGRLRFLRDTTIQIANDLTITGNQGRMDGAYEPFIGPTAALVPINCNPDCPVLTLRGDDISDPNTSLILDEVWRVEVELVNDAHVRATYTQVQQGEVVVAMVLEQHPKRGSGVWWVDDDDGGGTLQVNVEVSGTGEWRADQGTIEINAPCANLRGDVNLGPTADLNVNYDFTTTGSVNNPSRVNEAPGATATFLGIGVDCNNNGVDDSSELAGNDCNANQVPDDCEPNQDCNSNSIRDICDIGFELSIDCNSNLVPDECELQPDCNANSVPDECDLSTDCNKNGIPDECDADLDGDGMPDDCCTPAAPVPDLLGAKNRYLSIRTIEPCRSQAIRVIPSSLTPPFDIYNGTPLWVGPPATISENPGVTDPSAAPADPTFMAASLQCDPHFTDWHSVGTIYAFHEAVVPEGDYQIQVVTSSCGLTSESNFSDPLGMVQAKWGDVVSNCSTTPCGPPDGVVSLATDVVAILDKFQGVPDAIIKARADLDPNVPNQLITITDVTRDMDAFRGYPYPFVPSGLPCP